MKKCTNCSKNNSGEALFCQFCGNKFDAADQNSFKDQPRVKRKIPSHLLALGIAACFLMGVLLFVVLSRQGYFDAFASIGPEKTDMPRPNVEYSILFAGKVPPSECIFEVRLPEKISEDDIRQLADFLKANEARNCSPLYIFYYLPNDTPGTDTAWAYSHFDKEFVIAINGLDIDTESTLAASFPAAQTTAQVSTPVTKAATPSPKAVDNLVGKWLYDRDLPHTIVIRKNNGTYEMTTRFGDGSGETKTLVAKVVGGEERLYENPDNYYGDYMVIKKNGNLAFYDNQGFIFEFEPYRH